MDSKGEKRKAILERIASIEEAIVRAREYLESGKHEAWSGFRPLFVTKRANGKELPPHRDWIRTVFIPRKERALIVAERALEMLERKATAQANKAQGRSRVR